MADLFKVEYGTELIKKVNALTETNKVLLVTQENLWELYKNDFSSNIDLFFIQTMEESDLIEKMNGLDDFDIAVGFGGGMSIDAAKYFAYKLEKRCVLLPTIISVDACFSYPIAIRINNNVKYVGECIPEIVYVDYDIIKAAPTLLNRSGVADVLSCYTGLFDWKVMCENGKHEMNKEFYDSAEKIVDEIFNSVDDIRDTTEKGIQLIMNGYKWVGETSYNCGYCYFEEGSEHYFAYALESINKGHMVHGQLVCLGIYVMSKFHSEGRQIKIGKLMKDIGLSIKPKDVGVSYDEIEQTLKILNEYVVKENLAFSLLNTKKVTPTFITEVISELKAL
jgi:glycerol-1-phosphate dehydrogenase [NAD(P)+]